MSLFHLQYWKAVFLIIEFLVDSVFFQYLEYVFPLSFGLCCIWWETHHWLFLCMWWVDFHTASSLGAFNIFSIFGIQSFDYCGSRCESLCLSPLVFIGEFCPVYPQMFFLPLSLFFPLGFLLYLWAEELLCCAALISTTCSHWPRKQCSTVIWLKSSSFGKVPC